MYMYLYNFDKHINLQQVMCLYYDFNQDWHRLFFSYTKHSKINRLLRKCTFTKKTPPQTLGVKYGFDIFTICSTEIGEKNMNKQKYKYKCNKIYTLHKTIT